MLGYFILFPQLPPSQCDMYFFSLASAGRRSNRKMAVEFKVAGLIEEATSSLFITIGKFSYQIPAVFVGCLFKVSGDYFTAKSASISVHLIFQNLIIEASDEESSTTGTVRML
jgi:hypothetical protein